MLLSENPNHNTTNAKDNPAAVESDEWTEYSNDGADQHGHEKKVFGTVPSGQVSSQYLQPYVPCTPRIPILGQCLAETESKAATANTG